jgi:hypothetical protein
MKRVIVGATLWVICSLAMADTMTFFCEGKEIPNHNGTSTALLNASHRVVLDKITGTISVGAIKAQYYLTDNEDSYKAIDRDLATNRVNYTIELNRHSLELDYGYWAGDVWMSFRGKCVLFQSNI